MKINGRELEPHETTLFLKNMRNSGGIRVVGILTDVVIFVIMLFTVFTVGGYGVWLFNFIYAFMLFMVTCAFYSYAMKDVRQVEDDLRDRLICYSNSAVDWPFGYLGIFSTTKNFIVLLSAIPLAMQGFTFLAVVIPLCWIVNNMAIYARGNLTLDVIDHVLRQGKYETEVTA